jgi:hypothetical protein
MSNVSPPARPPGLAVDVTAVPAQDGQALRTDIAGFIGRTRRGPLPPPGAPPCRVRVQGQRNFDALFGGLVTGAMTPYAVKGYFDNDGQIAHVIRVAGPQCQTASALWDLTGLFHGKQRPPALQGGFACACYRFEASSPGQWANRARITLTYRRLGVSGTPAVDVLTEVDKEAPETIRGVLPATFADQINQTSTLIRVTPVAGAEQPAFGLGLLGAVYYLTLVGGTDDPPTVQSYLDAIVVMGDEREVALLAMPDLYGDVEDSDERFAVLGAAVADADQKQDRLVLVDVPPEQIATHDVIAWAGRTPNIGTPDDKPPPLSGLTKACQQASTSYEPDTARAAAVYYPRIWVGNPLATTPDEARLLLPPSGHVAGLISRLDRERGAYYTPANAPLLEVYDVARGVRASDRAVLNAAGVNVIRCFPNQGLLVYGGRTLGAEPGNVFVAHRRLLHRLVRAMRAVAEPLVFDRNGPELWLTLVRAITTVLVQAYRAGALAGDTPAQAFSVQCDDQTNPPDQVDAGRVLCLVGVAPAVPMEFIWLRISLDTEGRLEVSQ